MDFKVAGTRDFVTALQLDTKLDGIPSEVLAAALQQAHDARQTILDVMTEAISSPAGMSQYAPRVTTINIPVDKIGMVIGPKGQTINAIQDETGAEITIEDDGTIYVGAHDGPSAQAAVDRINAIANPTLPKVGRPVPRDGRQDRRVRRVRLAPARPRRAAAHLQGRRRQADRKVEDYLNVGDKVEVQIADIDDRGKIYLDKVGAEGRAAAAGRGGAPAGRDRGDRGPRGPGRRARPGRDAAGPAGGRRGRRRAAPAPRPRPEAPRHASRARTRTMAADPLGGTVRRTVLPNGLRILTESIPPMRSVSFGIWVGVGSRDEPPHLAGVSHFLEHLLFKGTRKRSALDISAAIEAVGGDTNAFTAREYTCYYARVLDADLPLAIDVVCDLWPTRCCPKPTWRPSAA